VILPATYPAALLLMLMCMLCWGSWANTHKLAGKLRFELFYYDYALGIALCAVIAAFTVGSMNSQDLTFQDNFLIASLRKIAYGFGAGMLLNLALVLFVGAVSVAGMGVTFPMCTAVMVLTAALWNYIPNFQANPFLLIGGGACLLASVAVNAFAYSSHSDSGITSQPRRPDPKKPGAARQASAVTGIVLAVLSGILMGLVSPIVDSVRSEETGIAPYGLALLLAAGIFSSTFIIVPFFMNFPVQGAPVEIRAYFSGTKKQHLWGVLGGIVWMAGTVAYLAATSTPTLTATDTAVTSSVASAAAVLGALWGLLVWRDFRGSRPMVKILLLGMLVLYAGGAGMVVLAPLYGK
jgi:glucose uptake protein